MAEKHFGVPMVLDARDMVDSGFPDKLSVITYVSQMYEYFKNKTPGMIIIILLSVRLGINALFR